MCPAVPTRTCFMTFGRYDSRAPGWVKPCVIIHIKRCPMSYLRLVFLSFFFSAAVTMATEGPGIQSTTEQKQEDRSTDSTESSILRELAAIRKEIEALRTEVGDLREKVGDIHRVAVRPSAPPPPETVNLDENRALGNADARVAIVEFSTSRGPSCRASL